MMRPNKLVDMALPPCCHTTCRSYFQAGYKQQHNHGYLHQPGEYGARCTGGRNSVVNHSGLIMPSTVGPSSMPAMSSPITAGLLKLACKLRQRGRCCHKHNAQLNEQVHHIAMSEPNHASCPPFPDV